MKDMRECAGGGVRRQEKSLEDPCGGALTMQQTNECLVFDMLVANVMEIEAMLTN